MRVCFSCVAGHGHVEPLLPLARAVRAADHDVVFATAPSLAETLAAAGFGTLAAGADHEQRTAGLAAHMHELARVPLSQRRPLLFTRVFALVEAPAKAGALLAAARAWQPDLIVHDVAWAGLAHHQNDLLDGRRIGRVTHALVWRGASRAMPGCRCR